MEIALIPIIGTIMAMADVQLSGRSPKISFLSSPNPSQDCDSIDNTRFNNEQDSSTVKSALKLTWTGDYTSLKLFVCNNLKLQGQ